MSLLPTIALALAISQVDVPAGAVGGGCLLVVDGLALADLESGAYPNIAAVLDRADAALVSSRTRSDPYSTTGINRRAYLIAAGAGRRLMVGSTERLERDGQVEYTGIPLSEPVGRLADALCGAGLTVVATTLPACDEANLGAGLDPGLVAQNSARVAWVMAPHEVGRLRASCAPGSVFAVVAADAASADAVLPSACADADRTGVPLFLLTMPPRGSAWARERLALFLRYGTGRGLLGSATTRRPGLIRITDVCPTILDSLGIAPPLDIEGRPAWRREAPADSTLSGLSVLNRDTRQSEIGRTTVFETLTRLAIVVACVAVALWSARGHSWLRGAVRSLAYGLLVAPAVLSLFPVLVVETDPQPVVWGAVLVSAGIGILLELLPLRVASVLAFGFTPSVFMLDQLFGGHLAAFSYLGYCLSRDSRLYGIGNSFSIITITCVLMLVGILTEGRRRGRLALSGLCLVPAVVIGAPAIGANTGGLLSAVFAAVLAAGLATGNPTLIAVYAVGAPLVAALAVVAVGYYDILAHGDPTTHLGHALKGVLEGDREWMGRTLHGKIELVRDRFRHRLWWGAVGTALLFVPWVWADRPRPMSGLPPLAYIVAAVATACFAGLVNDSGIVMTAMGCLPCIAAAALIHERGS